MYMALAAYSQYSFCSRSTPLSPYVDRRDRRILLWYFVIVTQWHQVSRTCRDSVETYSAEMGESPFMRDGWAVLQPTLTAQPSRSTQRTGPAVLLFLGSPRLTSADQVIAVCERADGISAETVL